MKTIDLSRHTEAEALLFERMRSDLDGKRLDQLNNEQMELYNIGKDLRPDEAHVIESMIVQAPEGGNYDWADLRMVRQIKRALDQGGPLKLEDAQYEWLARRLANVTLRAFDPIVLDLYDRIELAGKPTEA